jgi:phosphatidylglycerol lysyltransferase
MRAVRWFRDAEGRIAVVKTLRFVLVAILVAAFAWSALHELRAIHWKEVRLAFAEIDRTRIGFALLLLILNYLSLTLYDWMSFRVFGYKIPWTSVAPRAAAAFAFSNFVGLGFVSGAAVRLRLYRDLIPSPAVVARIIALNGISLWAGLLAIVGTALLFCPFPMDAPGHIGDLRPFGWLLIALPVLWIVFAGMHKWLPGRIRQILPPLGAPQVALLVAVSALDWVTLAMIYLALLGPIPPHTALGAATGFWLSYLFAMASLIPSGIGIFEAAITHFLAPQVAQPENVVAAALAYRILYYLFPWLLATLLMGIVATAPRIGTRMPALAERLRKLEPTLQEILTETLAILALIAGGVLWFSAAVPPLHDRVLLVAHNLPAAELLIAASHFTSVVAGGLLLLLSFGLQHRHRESWLLTMGALIVGAVFTFLKGLDWEEAAFLLSVAAVFWWARDRYDRRGRALGTRLAATAWGAVLACALAYVAIGLWIHRDVRYDPALWTNLALTGQPALATDTGRFLRSLLPIGGMIAWVMLYARWSGDRAPCPDPTPAEIALAKEIATKHADTTLPLLVSLGDKAIWFAPGRDGFLLWQRRGGSVLALGDPVGPPAVQRDLIREFRRFADEWDAIPAFYQVSQEHLPDYHALGFSFFQLGEEGFVDLAGFSIKGDKGKTFRAVMNQSARAGLTFEIVPAAGANEDDATKAFFAEIQSVSDAWLGEKSVAEKRFSLGFFKESYLRECPIAIVRKTEEGKPPRIVAFANLLATAGKKELSVDLMRFRPTDMEDMDFLFVNLMQWGQTEGYETFNLGMSPLAGVGEEAFAKPLERAARLLFLFGEHFYNFRGLRRFKEKFHPRWEPRYLAVPAEWQVPRVLIDAAAITSGGYSRIVKR